MLNALSVPRDRSFERFTIYGPLVDENNRVANDMGRPQHVPILANSGEGYMTSGRVETGQVDGPVPGIPIQSFVTAAPGNTQKNRTGPVTTRDIVAGLLEGRTETRTSSAGQSAFT